MIVQASESRSDRKTRRTVTLSNGKSTFFEISGIDLPPLASWDFAVLATVFHAMRVGEPIHVAGPVSSRLLRNLEEFQEAWALWDRRYKIVKITADAELPDQPPPDRKAVFAFSGGVDGTFALLRHARQMVDRRACEPVAACLVHGMVDIRLNETEAFHRAAKGAEQMTAALGVPLVTVSTDWVDQLCGEWTNEFGAAIGAVLHQFDGIASFGVFGADEDYAHLSFPWGSNPATNAFLSGGSFEIVTEGGGFTRTQRVREIAKVPELAKHLRVCWEGQTGGNCGKCEKCIRTKLNFMANGDEPICFETTPTRQDILGIRALTRVQRDYLADIYETARRNGISQDWVKHLKRSIIKNKMRQIPDALMRLVR